MHIVGNRPQFIKLAAVSKELQKRGYKEIIIHTGQHYDKNMSDIFFEELKLPKPHRNLGIGSGTHAQMTGQAMIKIEEVLEEYQPTCVLLYGDTDSTLAGALATVKTGIPIVHIEAGIRTGSLKNPEESNRIVTDHLSELLFCSDQDSMNHLKKEGIDENAFLVGDVMYDTFLQYRNTQSNTVLQKYHLKDNRYVLMTWHRQENTQSAERMMKIIQFLKKITYDIVYPIHPRTKAKLMEYELFNQLDSMPHIHLLPPISYVEMINLMSHAHFILTDSGGVSKESFFAGTKCLLMVNLNLWPDLIKNHWITKLDLDNNKNINDALELIEKEKTKENINNMTFYGTGNAAVKIVNILQEKALV